MRVHTFTVWEFVDGGNLRVVADSWYEYAGPVELAKKGRGEQKELIRLQMEQAKQEELRRQDELAKQEEARQSYLAERAKAEPFVASLESTQPGQLSSLAGNQYASDLSNINRTYGDIQQATLRNLSARGFGRAPSGFTTSAINTVGENKGRAETDAYRQAQERTYQQGLQALAYRTGQQGLSQTQQNIEQQGAGTAGSLTSANRQGASDAAYRLSQMGSTAGDILGGISDVAGVVAAPFTGGLSTLASRRRAPTNIGTYGPSVTYGPNGPVYR